MAAAAAAAAMFSSLKRRRLPTQGALLAPVGLPNAAVLATLRAVSDDLLSSVSGNRFFQRRNSRSLLRKLQLISVVLDCLFDVDFSESSSTVFLCLKELYLVLYRSKFLIEYVNSSGKLWLLLQNQTVSALFHDLNQEISTFLDVFPFTELNLSLDVKEQVELLRKQFREAKLYIDENDELLRMKFYYLLNEFENGRIPDWTELHTFFVKNLGIWKDEHCRFEIEFLEEQIVNHDLDLEPSATVLNGFVSIVRYCRFLLFEFEDEEVEFDDLICNTTDKVGSVAREIAVVIPKDFCCSISLDLMKDPVIVSTGQTYDRTSITRWMQEGHSTCPKSGQELIHSDLVPNRSLRNLIVQWCMANGIPYDTPLYLDYASFSAATALMNNAATIEATKATASLLVELLANGTTRSKTLAALEIRMLSKTGRMHRACIAEAGAIPLLKALLSSPVPIAQENAVTAILNLSIYEKNKRIIMDLDGCLGMIVEVLKNGYTVEARENAAATLFSLSAVRDYKKRLAQEDGAIRGLIGLLKEGTPRGKKDAVNALFNLSTDSENCGILVETGAVTALVAAFGNEGVSEEAAGTLGLLVRQPLGAAAVVESAAVAGLIGMMRCGTPKGKENAVAALLEMCKSGGAAAMETVVRAPALAGLVESLLFSGTKRARRKAASLARVFQRCENAMATPLGGFGVDYSSYAGNSGVGTDVTMTMPISVPVL